MYDYIFSLTTIPSEFLYTRPFLGLLTTFDFCKRILEIHHRIQNLFFSNQFPWVSLGLFLKQCHNIQYSFRESANLTQKRKTIQCSVSVCDRQLHYQKISENASWELENRLCRPMHCYGFCEQTIQILSVQTI